MTHKKSNSQLTIFLAHEVPIWLDKPCENCSSTYQVCCVKFLFSNETIKRLVNLCIKCRSLPYIKGY